jgi:hypothetical protein
MSKARERSGGAKSDDRLMALEVNGERLVIDNRAMTIRERRILRAELAKLPVEPDTQDWVAGGAWIALRRTEPDISYDEVCDSITVGDVSDLEMIEAEASDPE